MTGKYYYIRENNERTEETGLIVKVEDTRLEIILGNQELIKKYDCKVNPVTRQLEICRDCYYISINERKAEQIKKRREITDKLKNQNK